jgi:cytochrome P450
VEQHWEQKLIKTPEDIKTIFASRHQTYERKSPQMRRALEMLLGDGLFISDGSTWASRRPLVADIVHKNRVPTFAVAMEDVAAEFAERWVARGPDRPFDALSEMAELTAEIIARAVFGNRLGKEAARESRLAALAGKLALVERFVAARRLALATSIFLVPRQPGGPP